VHTVFNNDFTYNFKLFETHRSVKLVAYLTIILYYLSPYLHTQQFSLLIFVGIIFRQQNKLICERLQRWKLISKSCCFPLRRNKLEFKFKLKQTHDNRLSWFILAPVEVIIKKYTIRQNMWNKLLRIKFYRIDGFFIIIFR